MLAVGYIVATFAAEVLLYLLWPLVDPGAPEVEPAHLAVLGLIAVAAGSMVAFAHLHRRYREMAVEFGGAEWDVEYSDVRADLISPFMGVMAKACAQAGYTGYPNDLLEGAPYIGFHGPNSDDQLSAAAKVIYPPSARGGDPHDLWEQSKLENTSEEQFTAFHNARIRLEGKANQWSRRADKVEAFREHLDAEIMPQFGNKLKAMLYCKVALLDVTGQQVRSTLGKKRWYELGGEWAMREQPQLAHLGGQSVVPEGRAIEETDEDVAK